LSPPFFLLPVLYAYLAMLIWLCLFGGRKNGSYRKRSYSKAPRSPGRRATPGGPAPKVVQELAQRLFPDMNSMKLAQKTLEEACAHTVEVVEALREDLGLSAPHSEWESFTQEIQEALAVGGRVEVKCPFVRVESPERRCKQLKDSSQIRTLSLSCSRFIREPKTSRRTAKEPKMGVK
jgi:hypothetical protein